MMLTEETENLDTLGLRHTHKQEPGLSSPSQRQIGGRRGRGAAGSPASL
jgi:hypothetical protein